jgi:hypothetical protein
MPRRRRSASSLEGVEFPYLKDSQGRYAPIVYLQAWTGNRWLYLQAYVDSGASLSVFHVDVAQLLGIKLNRAKRRYVAHMGFNLMGRAGFFSRFELSFNDRDRLLTVTRITRSRR